MAVSLSDETIATMPEALLKRTGFLVHGTLGNIDPNPSVARPEGLIDRAQERIGRRSTAEA